MKYFGTILLMAALCTVQAAQTFKSYEMKNQANYYWVKSNLQKSMNALLELRSRAIIVAQERISGIDIGIKLKARGPPVTFQGAAQETDALTLQYMSTEECQRNALQDLQPYLERLRDLYARGKLLEKNLNYYKGLCKPAEGTEQENCVGRKMQNISQSLSGFESQVEALVKETTKACKAPMHKIIECFLDSASRFTTVSENEEDTIEDLEKDEHLPLKGNIVDDVTVMPVLQAR
ncbi:hypothetical protein KM043_017517 [Ampulex compressa]|nr:hypothetical protein KM043_017517 [Ampulex compressa]